MTGIEFADRRRQLHYSQSEMAVLMDKSRATIARWEAGEKPIDVLAALFIGVVEPKEGSQP